MKPSLRETMFVIGCSIALFGLGCSDDFYMTESSVRTTVQSLETDATAERMLSYFENRPVIFQFAGQGAGMHVTSSTLVDELRRVLALPEQNGWIDLDALAQEAERSLGTFVAQELGDFDDTNVDLSLSRITVALESEPDIGYDPSRQAADFELMVSAYLRGTVVVHGNFFDDIFGPVGTHSMLVRLENMRLRGSVLFRAPMRPEWTVHATPSVRVSVSGGEREVRDRTRELLQRRLAPAFHRKGSLDFERFSLTHLGLNRDAELEVRYTPAPALGTPQIDVVARDNAGALHHVRRESDQWTPPRAVPFGAHIGFAPALDSPAPGRLEAMAVARTGELRQISFADGRWGRPYEGFADGVTDTYTTTDIPQIIATHVGQLEIFVNATDQRLHHVRRTNGQWVLSGPVPVPAGQVSLPMGRHSSVQVGSRLVVAFADAQARVFVGAFDLESQAWGDFVQVPEWRAIYGPELAACGGSDVDLVFVDASGETVHTTVSVGWPGQTSLSPGVAMPVGRFIHGQPSVACGGYRQLDVMGVGFPQPRLRHKRLRRYPQARWRDWIEIDDPLHGTHTAGKVFAGFAARGAAAGPVHVVGLTFTTRGRATTFMHNRSHNDDAGALGNVWRGWDRLGRSRFTGKAGLTLTPQQFELVVKARDGDLRHARVVDFAPHTFSRLTDSRMATSIDPVIVPGGPGVTNVLTVGRDDRLRHRRIVNGSVEGVTIVAGPTIASPLAALSHGNGQLEVLALTRDRTLHHWRHVAGRWTASPVRLPTLVIGILSAPALVDQGAGQLTALAVGADRQLYRWSFAGGAWASPVQIASRFPLSATRFGPSLAVSPADGMIDVVVVEDGSGAMHYARLAANTSAVTARFSAVGASAGDTPHLISFSRERLHLIFIGDDGRVRAADATLRLTPRPVRLEDRLRSTRDELRDELEQELGRGHRPRVPVAEFAMVWSKPVAIARGEDAALLGGVAHRHAGELAAAMLGRDGRLRMMRYVDGRWSAALPLSGQPGAMRPPFHRPALVAR